VDCEPFAALTPDQAPDAEHVAAPPLDHVSVAESPELMVLGLAVSVTAEAKPETVTIADCVAEPPTPVHVSPYSVVLWRAPVDQVPLVSTGPLQPPEAVHAVASVELQDSVALPPLATVGGPAVRVTEGAGEVAATLGFGARPIIGLAATAATAATAAPEVVPVLSLRLDASQAASAVTTTIPSAHRTPRAAAPQRLFEAGTVFEWRLRPSTNIIRLPRERPWSKSPSINERRQRRSLRAHSRVLAQSRQAVANREHR